MNKDIVIACNLCPKMFESREAAGKHCSTNPTHHVRVVDTVRGERMAPRSEERRAWKEFGSGTGRRRRS